jgi:hypothetical protein
MANFDFIPFDGRQDLIEFTDGNSGEAFYYSADGDEYYNAKGEKVKDFFKKFKKGGDFWQKGLGAGLKKVANAIVKTERKILGKSTDKASETKEGRKADRDKRRAERKENRELKRQQKPDGSDVFTQPLKPADANTPADKVVTIEGQKLSAVDVPANTPIVVSTDPKTGEKVVGVDLKPQDVTAIKENDGTYSYYPANQVQGGNTNTPPPPPKMSTTTKIAIAVGGVAVLGVIVYLIAKKK